MYISYVINCNNHYINYNTQYQELMSGVKWHKKASNYNMFCKPSVVK